jgi:chorismate synthase
MNSFGNKFRITIIGESHASEVGIFIDGCPAGIDITEECFRRDLLRRATGSKGTSARKEKDIPLLLSGIRNNETTGDRIHISFKNEDIKSKDYDFEGFFRPGHADFVAHKKYKGKTNLKGGGQFSGRMTVGLVAAGVIAKKIIRPLNITAKINEIGGKKDYTEILQQSITEKDSIGGVIECNISNVPSGFGEPFFYSIESAISAAMFSIPGIKAIEFGEGIKSASMKGSEYNDVFIDKSGKTLTNNTGGINGGISNSNDIYFRVYARPTSSIGKMQHSYNFETKKMDDFIIKGRHDVCFALRLPPIVEAMTAVVLADLKLLEDRKLH